MAALLDTNILAYRFDYTFPEKQRVAESLMRPRPDGDELRIPYQALVEFFPAVTRSQAGLARPLLPPDDARREMVDWLDTMTIVWPDEAALRAALSAHALYRLNWFDALILGLAETSGCGTLYSEDFQHGRHYGRVRCIDPFQ